MGQDRYWTTVAALEHRPTRPYDETDASHLYLTNGTQVASFDRDFLGAALREVYAQWRARA